MDMDRIERIALMLNCLPLSEQQRYVTRWALQAGRFVRRRYGAEYVRALEKGRGAPPVAVGALLNAEHAVVWSDQTRDWARILRQLLWSGALLDVEIHVEEGLKAILDQKEEWVCLRQPEELISPGTVGARETGLEA